jgi:hypothetical protein
LEKTARIVMRFQQRFDSPAKLCIAAARLRQMLVALRLRQLQGSGENIEFLAELVFHRVSTGSIH